MGSRRRLVAWAVLVAGFAALVVGGPPTAPARAAGPRLARLDPRALAAARAAGGAWVLVSLTAKADLADAYRQPSKAARGRLVYERLRAVAERTQPPLVRWLEGRGARVERFWVDNLLRVYADPATLAALAARPGVAWVRLEGRIRLIEPVGGLPSLGPGPLSAQPQSAAPQVVESGIKEINADDVWRMGFKGENVVVAIADTGAELRHPAIKKTYRGYPKLEHDYNWLDAVKDDQEPLDVGGHGTHVTGIVAGADPVRQVGVAPGAKWISCRLIEARSGPDSASLRCLQWVVAPTKLDGTEPRPELAPDIVNASWGNDPGQGCLVETIHDAVRAVRAAGILFVAAAGNSGDGCRTVCVPGAYAESFTVGNYNERSNQINPSSSRGPADWPEGPLVKPDISAPGTDINSSVPPTKYEQLTGTSMASPHIAGAAALLLSAKPELKGRPELLQAILESTARKGRNTARCGPDGDEMVKDNVEGVGVADVHKAVVMALTATPVPLATATPTATLRPTETATLPVTETPPSTATSEPQVEPSATPVRFAVFAPYTARRWDLPPASALAR
jgi:subtilisin family serine protease